MLKESGHSEYSEKMANWQNIENKVDHIVDRIGQPIDKEIKPAVVALMANGFNTTASCEGHLDRGLPFPWVDIESPLSRDQRYNELHEKMRAEREGGPKLSKEELEEGSKFIHKMIEKNQEEFDRLQALLAEFYKENKGECVIQIDKGPWNQSRIFPKGFPRYGQLKYAQEYNNTLLLEQRGKNLELYRAEINRFANFLKKKYFNEI